MNNSTEYFFRRVIELLHKKAFDSYRIRLHNPYTIFDELAKSIDKYNKKRIKRFDPTVTSVGEEAKYLIDHELSVPPLFSFGSFSKKQVVKILEETCIKPKDGKKLRTLSLICNTICLENEDYEEKLTEKIQELLINDGKKDYELLDMATTWYVSQLLFRGYSRDYISRQIRKHFDKKKPGTIESRISKLKNSFTKTPSKFQLIYKVKADSIQGFKFASSAIRELERFPDEFKGKKFINTKFQELTTDERYLVIEKDSLDFWAALKTTNPVIAESIEINSLDGSDNSISLENQVLVIEKDSTHYRMLSTGETIDGHYKNNDGKFKRFIENFQKLENHQTAREKLRSAIRFYKLGNDSIETEHKFLNYWIGFEQLFSSVDTEEDSIKRIKAFFIALNSVYYWHRRVNYLLESIKRDGQNMTIDDLTDTASAGSRLIENDLNPLLKCRLNKYKATLNDNKQIKKSIEIHIKKLDQHFTRIYRLRNELIHEGRYTIDLQLITGHLRHYLIFSIEQITNELTENNTLEQLDDVFVYYENILTRIKEAKNIQEMIRIKPYIGYME